MDSVPDNLKSGVTLREALKDATVRFTHFARHVDETGTTTENMFLSFIRGMAVVCCFDDNVNIMVPILLHVGPIGEKEMTALMIKVKRQVKKGELHACTIDEAAIDFFPATSELSAASPSATDPVTMRSYISLIMELGRQKQVRYPTDPPARIRHKPKPSTVPPRQGQFTDSTTSHPRYSVFAYDCSHNVYEVIDPEQAGY